MIVHIVCFYLEDKSKKREVKKHLMKLKALQYFIELDIIEKFIHNKIEGDIVLFSKFKNEKELNRYMQDPVHLEVIRNTSALLKNKEVIDFQIANKSTQLSQI